MINILIQAVLLGGYYALIACGLAFMLQVMRVINLAHGSLAVVSKSIPDPFIVIFIGVLAGVILRFF